MLFTSFGALRDAVKETFEELRRRRLLPSALAADDLLFRLSVCVRVCDGTKS